ncbi:MAG: phosphoglycerate mutase family protein [Actinomycetota bacterium]|nr:phosphoglycerate mutase family protein [Actinomycetota bacterium]
MRTLTLIRHGRPVIEPELPASSWELAADAVAEVRALPVSAGTWFCSPEPKALATARSLTGADVTTMPDLREAERPAGWFDDPGEFHGVVREAFAQPDRAPVPGWEPLAAVRRRVAAAARTLLVWTPGDLVLVGHGTAWTLLVAELTNASPNLDAWVRMRMPDACELEVTGESASVCRPWGG